MWLHSTLQSCLFQEDIQQKKLMKFKCFRQHSKLNHCFKNIPINRCFYTTLIKMYPVVEALKQLMADCKSQRSMKNCHQLCFSVDFSWKGRNIPVSPRKSLNFPNNFVANCSFIHDYRCSEGFIDWLSSQLIKGRRRKLGTHLPGSPHRDETRDSF